MDVPFLPDEYTARARLAPAFLVVLPAVLLVLGWSPGTTTTWEVLWSVFIGAGGVVMLVQLGRDRGKQKQTDLFKDEGLPTDKILTHGAAKNAHIIRHRHAVLHRLYPQLPIPADANAEASDPAAARAVYEAAITFLRAKTRDRKLFALVFEENCNFGFRRNLWAWKDVGLTVSALSSAILGARLYGQFSAHELVAPVHVVLEAMNVLWVVLWIGVVTRDWVRKPGREYAQRLAESLDDL